VALIAFVVVIAVVAGAVYAVAHRGGSKPTSAASTTGGKATATPTGQATPSASSSASPKPSPTTSAQAAAAWTGPPSSDLTLHVRKVIVSADISPKSVVSTGTGLVFAQNMMYKHTITVYDTKTFKLVKTIPDRVVLADFGYKGKTASIQGAPVEAAETPDHRFMYVSQYSMYGTGFYHEGHDVGGPSSGFDKSFVYRVRLSDLKIDKVIKVGSVPKYLAVTPDQKYLLVSNWDSYSLSVVDVKKSKQIKEIYLGPYPRGIAVSPDSKTAYVAVMGSYDIAKVDLTTFHVSWIRGVGSGPRHIVMSPSGKYLYATLNGEGHVAKIDLRSDHVVDKVYTGSQPRSMAMATDGKTLYVVNYDSSTMTAVRTKDMKVIQTMSTNALPIGITYDTPTQSVWLCCYTGSIMVFRGK